MTPSASLVMRDTGRSAGTARGGFLPNAVDDLRIDEPELSVVPVATALTFIVP